MLGNLILLFIFIPLIELALLIQIGQWMGIFNTIMLVILTGVFGATLARVQGLKVVNRINRDLASGIMPSDALFDGVLILIGGIVLLTPGVLTDLFGFFLLIPRGRQWIRDWLKRKIENTYQDGRVIQIKHFHLGD